jgi:hypothetical protein
MPTAPEASLPTLNGLTGPGRPTKRTKKVVTELLDAVSAGAPFNIACQAAGIGYQTFQDWRRSDPSFALEVDQAVARGTVSRLKEIEAQGRGGAWQALSWLCERRHPAEFAKPEVALNIGIQNNLAAQGGNGNSFEALVVSDLEFLGLAKREGYQHRPVEREAREVEAEIVPENLSGALVVANHPGGAVISESQAAENERRSEQARKKIEALLAAKVGQSSETQEPEGVEPATEALVPGTIVMPNGLVTPEWWAQFCQGDSGRLVERQAAQWVCQTLAKETLGAAGNVRIDFEEDVSVGDVIVALERISGSRGRQRLLKKAGLTS